MSERVAVYGTGTIGSGQATLSIGNGFETVVLGHSKGGQERCWQTISQNWDDLIAAGLATTHAKGAALNRLTITDDPAALAECTFVFEAVAENPTVKRDVYQPIRRNTAAGTVIASTTSSLEADVLAGLCEDPAHFLVAHPFQPVHLQPLVEVVPCTATADEAMAQAKALLVMLHRQVVILRKSVPGFLVNRFAQALFRESLDLLEKGVATAEDIDRAVKYAMGMRYASIGLLEYFDAVGFDLEKTIAENTYPSLCNTREVQTIVKKGIRSGCTGQKAGKGLYSWDEESLADFHARLLKPFLPSVMEWSARE